MQKTFSQVACATRPRPATETLNDDNGAPRKTSRSLSTASVVAPLLESIPAKLWVFEICTLRWCFAVCAVISLCSCDSLIVAAVAEENMGENAAGSGGSMFQAMAGFRVA